MSIGGAAGGSEADDGALDPSDVTREVHDTPAEVDAAFRAMRKVAFTYFAVFFGLIAAFPVLSLTVRWWTESRVIGDLSPGFITAAGLLYLLFAVLGLAGAARSTSIESQMLGGTAHDEPDGRLRIDDEDAW